MEFNVVDLNSSEKEVEIKLQYDEIKKEIEEEVKKQTKKIQIPGFRKGKAPLSMLKKMYGDAFEYEASEKIANSFFWKIADENQLRPIGQPTMTDLKFEPEKDLSFKVKFETVPVLNVKDYTNLTLEIPEWIVNETEIQKEIDYFLKTNNKLEDAEQITDNQFVIDAEVLLIEKNGEKIPDVKPEKMQIDLTADGISKEIITNSKNKKVGESFNFVFKDEHTHKHDDGTEEVHKEEYHYDVKILGLKKIIYPELNEEMIKKMSRNKFTAEADLREDIRKDLQSYYDNQTEEMIRFKLINEILKNNEFIPPRTLVNNILDEYLKKEEEHAKKSKYPFNKEEARKRMEKSAETEVKWYLVKNEIQKAENISLTDQDLNDLAESESVKTGLSVEKLISYYKSSNQGERILDKKLFDFLKSSNTIVKVDAEKFKSKQEVTNEK